MTPHSSPKSKGLAFVGEENEFGVSCGRLGADTQGRRTNSDSVLLLPAPAPALAPAPAHAFAFNVFSWFLFEWCWAVLELAPAPALPPVPALVPAPARTNSESVLDVLALINKVGERIRSQFEKRLGVNFGRPGGQEKQPI